MKLRLFYFMVLWLSKERFQYCLQFRFEFDQLGLLMSQVSWQILQDNEEAKTEAGQISIGILIFQDVWAIIVLAVQNHLDSPRFFAICKTFTVMLAMVSTLAASTVDIVFFSVFFLCPRNEG